VTIKPWEEILLGAGKRFCVLDLVPFEEVDHSPFVGKLKVEAVSNRCWVESRRSFRGGSLGHARPGSAGAERRALARRAPLARRG
jgi:hypothetical protein